MNPHLPPPLRAACQKHDLVPLACVSEKAGLGRKVIKGFWATHDHRFLLQKEDQGWGCSVNWLGIKEKMNVDPHDHYGGVLCMEQANLSLKVHGLSFDSYKPVYFPTLASLLEAICQMLEMEKDFGKVIR